MLGAGPRRSILTLAVLLPAAAGTTQDEEPGAHVAALQREATRAGAHARLVELGAAAVPSLVAALGEADGVLYDACLAVLRDLGPQAGPAFPALLSERTHRSTVWLLTIGEVVLFRASDVMFDARSVVRDFNVRLRRELTVEESVAQQRWILRAEFSRSLDTPSLVATAGGLNALRAEVAVELLGVRGAAARNSLRVLGEILERPDPRVLGVDQRVPLRRKAARAVLQIDPAGELAALARRVLAGTQPPPDELVEVMPARLRERVDQLLADLARADCREAAIENLLALGEAVAAPTGAALAGRMDTETARAALTVLQRLGPAAVTAVPDLFAALRLLPTDCTVPVLNALAAIAPWSRDVIPVLTYSGGIGRISVLGAALPGGADPAFWNDFTVAVELYRVALDVDPSVPISELRALLAHPYLRMRERALVLAGQRGAECRPLLDRLSSMLEERQPESGETTWLATGVVERMVDRTPQVHRLVAETILAIAAPEDPRRVTALAVLSTSEPR
jgi:hypothetical protein